MKHLYCFSASLSSLFPPLVFLAGVGFTLITLLHAPPDSPTKKSQLPNAYSMFPQGIGPGDYEENELEEGCGEIQHELCWSPLMGHQVVRAGVFFSGCFWWLAFYGGQGGGASAVSR